MSLLGDLLYSAIRNDLIYGIIILYIALIIILVFLYTGDWEKDFDENRIRLNEKLDIMKLIVIFGFVGGVTAPFLVSSSKIAYHKIKERYVA